ncbi:MAG: hypothetical protein OXS33_02310 [bacterium]|nr:hypothetical protein [bacterium]
MDESSLAASANAVIPSDVVRQGLGVTIEVDAEARRRRRNPSPPGGAR